MATEIRVPTLGESVTEATVAKWFKKVGETVAADEALVELETDKVTLEVPSPAAGVIEAITAADGTTVGVGAILGSIAAAGAAKAVPAPTGKPEQKTETARPIGAGPEEPRAKTVGIGQCHPEHAARGKKRGRPNQRSTNIMCVLDAVAQSNDVVGVADSIWRLGQRPFVGPQALGTAGPHRGWIWVDPRRVPSHFPRPHEERTVPATDIEQAPPPWVAPDGKMTRVVVELQSQRGQPPEQPGSEASSREAGKPVVLIEIAVDLRPQNPA